MPASLSDKILVTADVLILGAVLAAGAVGGSLPLAPGQDVLVLGTPEPTAAAVSPTPAVNPARPPEPAQPSGTAQPEVPSLPEPAAPPKPGQAEWGRVYAAKQRGLVAVDQARSARATEPDRKRKAYDEAKAAFKEALAAAKEWRACEGVDPSSVDQQEQEIRMMIFECDKSRPMGK